MFKCLVTQVGTSSKKTERIRRCGLVGGSVSLGQGFKGQAQGLSLSLSLQIKMELSASAPAPVCVLHVSHRDGNGLSL